MTQWDEIDTPIFGSLGNLCFSVFHPKPKGWWFTKKTRPNKASLVSECFREWSGPPRTRGVTK